jgi:proteasome accessory factor C
MSRTARKIDELTRQLNLLPYFQRHPDRTVMEAARDFGLQPGEIMADLNRLWMCGLPGLLPGDLVELEHSYTSVKIHNAQGMDKALRLTPTEAGVLLLTLESLENLPGLTNQEAVVSAAEKLRGIMGDYTTAVFDSVAEGDEAQDNSTLAVIGAAINQRKQVRFLYHSHSSDTTSTRQVSPARIFTTEGETYVRAWEYAVNDHRTFRVDRIREITLSEADGDPHLARLKFSADDPFAGESKSEVVHFLLREEATWLADYMSMELAGQANYISDDDGVTWVPASRPLYSRDWFIRFSISQADRMKVTGPDYLVESINKKICAGLSAYDDQLK